MTPPSARQQSEPAGMEPAAFRELCEAIAELQYRDIPVGAALGERLVIDLLWGHGDWRWRTRALTQTRRVWHRLHPRHGDRAAGSVAEGRVLVTWYVSTPRLDDMLLPVVEEIGLGRCLVLVGRGRAPTALPPAAAVFDWQHAAGYRPKEWRAHYRRARPHWARTLRDLCRRFDLPKGAYGLLSLEIMVSSQRVEGFVGFLDEHRPAALLTEYDRNHLWASLVLAARRLGIPTATLVHGVMGPEAIGFSPVLADHIICWGESDRGKLLAAGEPSERVVIGGCPRLTRDLPLTAAEAKIRLGLDQQRPVVLLATSPDRGRLRLAGTFCAALEATPAAAGVVRLHPAETEDVYAEVASRYPSVRFMDNSGATLDESLAAADVVVVRGSGVGGDALLKRRPVIVLDPEGSLAGSDRDLVESAGCPYARTAEELAEALALTLADPEARERQMVAAEGFVGSLCSAFGRDSARLIADLVRRWAGMTEDQA